MFPQSSIGTQRKPRSHWVSVPATTGLPPTQSQGEWGWIQYFVTKQPPRVPAILSIACGSGTGTVTSSPHPGSLCPELAKANIGQEWQVPWATLSLAPGTAFFREVFHLVQHIRFLIYFPLGKVFSQNNINFCYRNLFSLMSVHPLCANGFHLRIYLLFSIKCVFPHQI